MPTRRLDKLLVEQNKIPTRSRASDFIKRGLIKVDGRIIQKPGALVPEDAKISIESEDIHYVSRGSLKLKSALEHFKYPVKNTVALDVGASTGGFVQVLLEAGASKVYAVDVGQDQLHEDIKKDSKVIFLEKQDARTLTLQHIPEAIDIITCDTSFISLMQVLEKPMTFAKDQAALIALIKPQFEVGKKGLGKGGIVRDSDLKAETILKIKNWMNEQAGWSVDDVIASPIIGGSGNEEYLLGAKKQC